MIDFILAINAKGFVRLERYFRNEFSQDPESKSSFSRDLFKMVLERNDEMSTITEFEAYFVTIKRFASLFIIIGSSHLMDAVEGLDMMLAFMQQLNEAFRNNLCENDFIQHLPKVYAILDEMVDCDGNILTLTQQPVDLFLQESFGLRPL